MLLQLVFIVTKELCVSCMVAPGEQRELGLAQHSRRHRHGFDIDIKPQKEQYWMTVNVQMALWTESC